MTLPTLECWVLRGSRFRSKYITRYFYARKRFPFILVRHWQRPADFKQTACEYVNEADVHENGGQYDLSIGTTTEM